MQRYIAGTTPSPERVEESRSVVKRLAEYDDTIEIWESKMAHAAQMVRNAREAKQRFISSIAPSRGA